MRMLLDGPNLEELLLRARDECGANGRIVKAEKIRPGGLAGLFARDRYELTIEIDDVPAEPSAANAAHADTGPATPAAAPRSAAASLLDLAEAISDREIDAAARQRGGPRLSTEGLSFASVLEELANTIGDGPDSVGGKSADGAAGDPKDSTARPADSAAVTAAEFPRLDSSDPSVVRSRIGNSALRGDRPVPGANRRGYDAYDALHPATAATLPARLHGLGIPQHFLPSDGTGDLLAALVAALRALPPAPQPPTRPGDILAVVGDGETTWDAALNLAASVQLDERAMVYVTARSASTRIAPTRRITAVDQIPPRRERWVKRTTPVIAVVDAPMAPQYGEFGRSALQALDAAATWLVVPATRKTGDVALWVKRLGRADALILTDVEASADPAAVLSLGIPVARLDNEIANTRTWGGLILQRLVEAR